MNNQSTTIAEEVMAPGRKKMVLSVVAARRRSVSSISDSVTTPTTVTATQSTT